MTYTFDYPQRVRAINGRRHGAVALDGAHLAQTHEELIVRFDEPGRSITVQATVDATTDRVWAVTGSPTRLLSHQPRFAGLSRLDALGILEGARYIIHRAHEGRVFDRFGEILVNIPGYQLTVSDIDVVDPSVSGHFPSLYTVRLEQDPEDADRCVVQLTYTTLGVIPGLIPAVLLLQLRSIQECAEEASLSQH